MISVLITIWLSEQYWLLHRPLATLVWELYIDLLISKISFQLRERQICIWSKNVSSLGMTHKKEFKCMDLGRVALLQRTKPHLLPISLCSSFISQRCLLIFTNTWHLMLLPSTCPTSPLPTNESRGKNGGLPGAVECDANGRYCAKTQEQIIN